MNFGRMDYVYGVLSAPIKWRVTLKRKSEATGFGQADRRRVEEVSAESRGAAGKAALALNNNSKYFVVEAIREVR